MNSVLLRSTIFDNSTFSAQGKRQLQITFPRLESECFKDVLFYFVYLHVDRLADNTISVLH